MLLFAELLIEKGSAGYLYCLLRDLASKKAAGGSELVVTRLSTLSALTGYSVRHVRRLLSDRLLYHAVVPAKNQLENSADKELVIYPIAISRIRSALELGRVTVFRSAAPVTRSNFRSLAVVACAASAQVAVDAAAPKKKKHKLEPHLHKCRRGKGFVEVPNIVEQAQVGQQMLAKKLNLSRQTVSAHLRSTPKARLIAPAGREVEGLMLGVDFMALPERVIACGRVVLPKSIYKRFADGKVRQMGCYLYDCSAVLVKRFKFKLPRLASGRAFI